MGTSVAIPQNLTVSQARDNLYDIINEVSLRLRRFVISHHGKPTAVVLPIEDLESWEESLDIASNRKLMADIRRSIADYKKGRYFTLDQVEAKLKKRLKAK